MAAATLIAHHHLSAVHAMSNRGYRGGGNQASAAISSRLPPCRAAVLTCITCQSLWSLQGGGWGGNRGGGGGGGGRGGENIACCQRLLPAAGPLGKQLHLPSLAHTLQATRAAAIRATRTAAAAIRAAAAGAAAAAAINRSSRAAGAVEEAAATSALG